MSGAARTKNKNSNLKELVQKFYFSDAPFWPVVNTNDYKSPRNCMGSIRLCLSRMKAVGCISLRVFPNPNVEGHPKQVYLCTNEFAASGLTPEEYYIQKEHETIANYCENDVKTTAGLAVTITNTEKVETFEYYCDRVIAEYKTRQGIIKSKIAELQLEYDRLEAAISAIRNVSTIDLEEEN